MSASVEVRAAADALRAGQLVGFPTETVYGLGADATNPEALHRLYAAKGRPADHPVIVHLGACAAFGDDAFGGWAVDVSSAALRLGEQWWPGPLTLVVRAADRVSRVATGGLDTVGLRVPAHPMALELLAEFDGGIAAPSANRFGRVSPTTAGAVRAEFGDEIAMVLEGGPCAVGVESTIVDCTGSHAAVLRPGAITAEMIAELLGAPPRIGGSTRAPGTLASHYAPLARGELVDPKELRARLAALRGGGQRVGVIEWGSPGPGDDPGGPSADHSDSVVTLATVSTAEEYAHELYSALRKADECGVDLILAVTPPLDGVGIAVADRLRRAASDR